MSKDIRVALSFFNHHKTRRLHLEFGDGGVVSLLKLWAYCAEHQHDGDLSKWDELLFKIACERDADCMLFVKRLACEPLNFLDKTEKSLKIHDWKDHQPWVFFSKKRSEIASKNASKRWKSKEKKANANGMQMACNPHKVGNAPSPSPSPSPSPNTNTNINIVDGNGKEGIPYSEIIEYLNLKTGKSYKKTSTDSIEHIKARWKDGYRLDDFKKCIDNMSQAWKDDSDMDQYLRPATLFAKGKFEGYVNRTVPDKKKGEWL